METPAAEPAETTPAASPAAPVRGLWRDAYGRAAIRSLQTLLIAGVVGLGVWLAATLKLVTLPLLIALIIAAAMNPIIRALRTRARFSRVGAAVAALLAILMVLAAIISGIVMTVIEDGRTCPPRRSRAPTSSPRSSPGGACPWMRRT